MSEAPNSLNIDVRKYFSQQREYRGVLGLSQLPRLQALLADNGDSSDIRVDLQFEKNSQNECFITGTIEAELILVCQRCLGDLPYHLQTRLAVRVLEVLQASGDRELEADELEVVLSEQGRLDLRALIEDEVILSLPIVSSHDAADCNQQLSAFRTSAEAQSADRQNKPFAALEALKEQLQAEKQKLKSVVGKGARGDKPK